jgi:uncharacterized membrane protein
MGRVSTPAAPVQSGTPAHGRDAAFGVDPMGVGLPGVGSRGDEPSVAESLPGVPDGPSWHDPTVARASEIVGGPIGRYAASSRAFSVLAILLMLCSFTLLCAFAEKSPCASGDWTNYTQYSHACYSDILPMWDAEGLSQRQVPYKDHAVEYPVLTGAAMWVAAQVTYHVSSWRHVAAGHQGELFNFVTDLGLCLCALMIVYFAMGTNRGRPWDAALFAVSPLLVFHAFSNWDLLAMMFAAWAMWAWSRERVVLTGVMIGLGTAAKLYPALLLVALVPLAIRTGQRQPVVRTVSAAVLTWAVVNVPVALVWRHGWWEFFHFNQARGTEWDTFWGMGYAVAHHGQFASWVPSGVLAALAVLLAESGVAWLALAVAVFLLTSKIWSRQYSLWLVPLVALARPRWRMSLLWQSSEILVWVVFLLFLEGMARPNHAIYYGWFAFIVIIRDAFLLAILGLVGWEMWHPEADVVRAGGADDPSGGVFDRTVDAFSLSAAARAERRRRAAAALAEPVDVVEVGSG